MTGLNRKTTLIPITAIFLGLFAAPITAYAQEWRTAWRNVYTNRFGSTVSYEVLYDSSSMRRVDRKIRVWVKEVTSFSDVTSFSEYLSYYEFDCEERSYRIL
jgi:hypothetical protein